MNVMSWSAVKCMRRASNPLRQRGRFLLKCGLGVLQHAAMSKQHAWLTMAATCRCRRCGLDALKDRAVSRVYYFYVSIACRSSNDPSIFSRPEHFARPSVMGLWVIRRRGQRKRGCSTQATADLDHGPAVSGHGGWHRENGDESALPTELWQKQAGGASTAAPTTAQSRLPVRGGLDSGPLPFAPLLSSRTYPKFLDDDRTASAVSINTITPRPRVS